jgi:hypothetical protein
MREEREKGRENEKGEGMREKRVPRKEKHNYDQLFFFFATFLPQTNKKSFLEEKSVFLPEFLCSKSPRLTSEKRGSEKGHNCSLDFSKCFSAA